MKRLLLLVFCLAEVGAFAQKTSVSTNIMEYANMITLNAGTSYAVHKHFTLNTNLLYNPFEFDKGGGKDAVRNKQLSASVGARYWPWHIYSGWWIAANAKYQLYNYGGLRSPQTREGDRFGGEFAFGYSYMLSKKINLEFGLGAWTGLDNYRIYNCPVCGLKVEEGRKFFLIPSELIIALSYVF